MPCGRPADWLTGAWPSPPDCPHASHWMLGVRCWMLDVSRVRGEGDSPRSGDELEHFRYATTGETTPASLGRVGVRRNGPHPNLTSQTLAGNVKCYESSGRVGELPSGPTRCPAANLLHGKASAAWEPLPLINTQLQLGVWRAERRWNRFSGFSFPRARAHSRGYWPPWSQEAVETVGPQ